MFDPFLSSYAYQLLILYPKSLLLLFIFADLGRIGIAKRLIFPTDLFRPYTSVPVRRIVFNGWYEGSIK